MPGGIGLPTQATPQQLIAQGITGLSSLTGHPAPDFLQKMASQPIEMQMERYKAYVGAQANMMTEQYKKADRGHRRRHDLLAAVRVRYRLISLR
jgi:hypothetical protein